MVQEIKVILYFINKIFLLLAVSKIQKFEFVVFARGRPSSNSCLFFVLSRPSRVSRVKSSRVKYKKLGNEMN